MAIVFAWNGAANSLDAKYSGGRKLGLAFGNTAPAVTANAGAISGYSINWAANNNAKGVSWSGRYNVPNGRAISVLCRIDPGYTGSPAAGKGIWGLGVGFGKLANIELNHNTSGNLIMQVKNELSQVAINSTSFGAWSPTSGTFYDLVFTWDGTTTASSANVYVDATSIGTVTPSFAFSASWAQTWFTEIVLGTGNIGNTLNNAKIEEFVIWDSVITPSSVGLVSGTGSLNGASRSSLVDVSTFEGNSYTDVGVANVLSTASYTYAGTSKTGTYVGPTAANVKTGVSFGVSSTGTYDGSDRWSDPGESNVRLSTAYKANSTTNNKTGTAAIPTAANVRSGTATDATTGTLAVPSAANVLSGVSVDATTGTYVTVSTANVRSGTTFGAASALTGLLDLPAEADVRDTVVYDNGTKTGTYTGGGLTAQEVADAVWDAALTDHSVSGSFGERLKKLLKTGTFRSQG